MSELCDVCHGRCGLTTTGTPMSNVVDVVEDLVLAQNRWRKACEEGNYFRAERWAKIRDLALDHLPCAAAPRLG